MLTYLAAVADHVVATIREERGAIGWLVLGIVIGAIGIIVLIVKLLIPGD